MDDTRIDGLGAQGTRDMMSLSNSKKNPISLLFFKRHNVACPLWDFIFAYFYDIFSFLKLGKRKLRLMR